MDPEAKVKIIPPGEHRVCLNIICKNEAVNLKVLFPASEHLIDHYVVVDTGSDDGTQEVVVEEGSKLGITGRLVQSQWYDDYGRSREEALEACRNFMRTEYGERQLDRCWALFIDPDEKYIDRRTREAITPTTKRDLNAHLNRGGDLHMNLMEMGRTSFDRTGFARLSLPFRWEHALHEIVTCPCAHHTVQCPVLLMVPHGIGAHRRQKDRSDRDCAILQRTMKKYGRTTRYIFYLAQSLNEAGRLREAFMLYDERQQRADGYGQERYMAALRNARLLLSTPFALGYNPAQAQILAFGYLIRATEFDQNRFEAPALLAKYFRLAGLYKPAFFMSQAYLRNGGTKHYSPLFAEPEAERELKQEAGISAWWAGEQNCSLHVIRDSIREAVLENKEPNALDQSNLATCENIVTIKDPRLEGRGEVCFFPLLPEGLHGSVRVLKEVLRNYVEFVPLATACVNDMRPNARFLQSPWAAFLANVVGCTPVYLEQHPYSGRVIDRISLLDKISATGDAHSKLAGVNLHVALIPIMKKAPKKGNTGFKLTLADGTVIPVLPNSLIITPFVNIDQKGTKLPPFLVFAFGLETAQLLHPM